jgi:hypothetical protein
MSRVRVEIDCLELAGQAAALDPREFARNTEAALTALLEGWPPAAGTREEVLARELAWTVYQELVPFQLDAPNPPASQWFTCGPGGSARVGENSWNGTR